MSNVPKEQRNESQLEGLINAKKLCVYTLTIL